MTLTTNYGLRKYNSGDTGWDVGYNAAMDTIDAALASKTTTQAPVISTASATMAFDGSNANHYVINLTADVTSSTINNPVDGREYSFTFKTDGVHGFTFPASFLKSRAISTANGNNASGGFATQKWRYDAASTKFYASTPLVA